jgi:hypothetical protein
MHTLQESAEALDGAPPVPIPRHQRAQDFQAFLHQVHRQYRGWQVTLLLDSDSSHTANGSQALAAQLGIRLLWLPRRAPELTPMNILWGQGKDAMNASKQYKNIDEQAESFITYLSSLSNKEALQTSSILCPRIFG